MLNELGLTGAARVLELHREIRRVSRLIGEIESEQRRLSKLYLEFTRLALDKLTLDAARDHGWHEDAGFSALRVINGRVQAAAQYFGGEKVPLLEPKVDVTIDKPKSSKSLRTESSTQLSSRSSADSSCRIRFAFTTKRSQQKLGWLQARLSALLSAHEGLSATVQRFREDNTALRYEINTMRHNEAAVDSEFWLRLANVDLYVPSSETQSHVASQRRMSALSARRRSFTSAVHRAHSHRFTELKQSWDSCSLHSRARPVSGTTCDTSELGEPSMHKPLFAARDPVQSLYSSDSAAAYGAPLPLGRTISVRSSRNSRANEH